MIIIRRTLMLLAAAVLLPSLAQTARADSVSFSCGPCTAGTITGGPPFSTSTAIAGLTSSLLAGDLFSFSFNTAVAGSPLLTDGSDEILHGTIVPGSLVEGTTLDSLTFSVVWDLTGAMDVQNVFKTNPNFFGGPSHVDFEPLGSSVTPGQVDAALITIRGTTVSPVPEPGTIALLGTGLLVCGRLLRRKREDGEESAV
jgi:PEP-CTERM motif